MYFKTADVGGLRLFYREAGYPSKPTIVLLHGFPSSSYQFHNLIPPLADRFHVIAPDYPGMGFSDAPDPTVLRPTFDDVAMVIDAFITQRAPARRPESGQLGDRRLCVFYRGESALLCRGCL